MNWTGAIDNPFFVFCFLEWIEKLHYCYVAGAILSYAGFVFFLIFGRSVIRSFEARA